jgi:radical SAM superfamily enzyme YgiQ (UPF0313 family)
MKPRILLISPKGRFFSQSKEFEDFMRLSREMRTVLHFWNGISAALPTIAALTPVDFDISIIDENLENINFSQPCDIVGITAITQQALRAYEIADEFLRQGRYVVIGGIHATVMPDEALAHANTVFIGEAEHSWPKFLHEYLAGSPAELYRQNQDQEVDMTCIPLPRYDLLAKYHYPVVWIQSGRGCPHDCEFCAATRIYGGRCRHKEVEQLVLEIEEAKKFWKCAQIGFADDNMFVDKSYARRLLKRFQGLHFSWYAQTDISIAKHEDILTMLHDSGCRTLFIGFESVIAANLDNLTGNPLKHTTIERNAKYIDKIQSHGIGVYGSFILGLDADDDETAQRTLQFIIDTHMMGAQITLLTPFPGSRVRTRLEEQNRILHNDWNRYSAWNAVIEHPRLSPTVMENSMLEIYRGMYNEKNCRQRAIHFAKIFRNLASQEPIIQSAGKFL